MSPAFRVKPALAAACLLAGGACAALTFLLLSALARPSGWQDRLEASTVLASRAETLKGPPGETGVYAPDAVCEAANASQVRDIELALGALAMESGFEVTAAARAAGEAPGGLTVIEVNGRGSAPYEAVVGFLGKLDGLRPQVFVDTLDIRPEGGMVSLRFKGRVLCDRV